MIRIALTIVFGVLVSGAYGQRMVKGIVVSSEALKPVPYAHVYMIGNPMIGTNTDRAGRFQLNVPSIQDTLVISHITYNIQKIPLETFNTFELTIKITERHALLDEVIIMPHESLLDLLRKAYASIPKNYPDSGALVTGFYQETIYLHPDKFLYRVQSELEFYQPPYYIKRLGPVRIKSGTITEIPNWLAESNLAFYGGHFMAQRQDFVKERAPFINPKNFNDFNYEIRQVPNDPPAYKILFKSKNKPLTGEFYLEQKSLAYIMARLEIATETVTEELDIQQPYKRFDKKGLVRYVKHGDKWILHQVHIEGKILHPINKKIIAYSDDFQTTSYKPVTENPLSEKSTLPLREIISFKLHEYPTLTPIDPDSTEAKSHGTKNRNGWNAFLVKVIPKVSSSFSIGLIPTKLEAGTYNLTVANVLQVESTLSPRYYQPILSSEFAIRFKRNFHVGFNSNNSFQSNLTFALMAFSVEWQKRISGIRYPLNVHAGFNLYNGFTLQRLGTYTLTDDYDFNNRTVDGKVEIRAGAIQRGVNPYIKITKAFSGRLYFMLKASWGLYEQHQSILTIREKSGFFLTRKTIQQNLPQNQILITQNNIPLSTPLVQVEWRPIVIEVGIRLGF